MANSRAGQPLILGREPPGHDGKYSDYGHDDWCIVESVGRDGEDIWREEDRYDPDVPQ